MAEYDGNIRIIKTDEEVKVFTDPYRMKIIYAFVDHKEPLTVKGVADIMGEVPAKVHYHVKKLLAVDIIELDHIEVINGINAKYYRLLTDEFRLDIQPDFVKQGDAFVGMIDTIYDEFKGNLIQYRAYKEAQKSTDNPVKQGGFIVSEDLYLTDEEFAELDALMRGIKDKYTGDKKGKKRYVSLLSVMPKVEGD